MSEKEKKVLEVMESTLPNMSEFNKGYLLGMGEAMANAKREKAKEAAEDKKTG